MKEALKLPGSSVQSGTRAACFRQPDVKSSDLVCCIFSLFALALKKKKKGRGKKEKSPRLLSLSARLRMSKTKKDTHARTDAKSTNVSQYFKFSSPKMSVPWEKKPTTRESFSSRPSLILTKSVVGAWHFTSSGSRDVLTGGAHLRCDTVCEDGRLRCEWRICCMRSCLQQRFGGKYEWVLPLLKT